MRSVDMRSVELKPLYLLRKGHFYKRFYESRLWFSEFIYRVKLSIKARHWLGHKEYMNVLMDESKRGN